MPRHAAALRPRPWFACSPDPLLGALPAPGTRLAMAQVHMLSTMLIWLAVFTAYFWLALALMLVSVLTRALALTVLWAWFVEPTFGFAPLSLAMAAGLITVVYLVFSSRNYLTALREKTRRDDKEKNSLRETVQSIGALLIHELVTPVSAVALGWILVQVVS
jgi:hypothetical protein